MLAKANFDFKIKKNMENPSRGVTIHMITGCFLISYRGIGSRISSFPAKCVGIFDDETFTKVRK